MPGALVEVSIATSPSVRLARASIVQSTNPIATTSLLARVTKRASLTVSLADGTRTTFSGDITQVAMLGSEGGLARYRVRLTPWLWPLTQARNSRVWQDKSVIDIVDDVLGAYQPLAQWRWSGETDAFMADIPPRSYCCQYRETNYEFAHRLLTEEGLASAMLASSGYMECRLTRCRVH